MNRVWTVAPVFNLSLNGEFTFDGPGGPIALAWRQRDPWGVPGEALLSLSDHQKLLLDEPMAWIELQRDSLGDEKFSVPYVMSDGEHHHPGPGLNVAHRAARGEIDYLVAAIRLVKESKLWVPWVLTFWGDVEVDTHVGEVWSAIRYGEVDCRLGTKDLERIRVILANLSTGAAASSRYQLAFRRYSSALDRLRSEDAIIDLCIALEAAVSTDPMAPDRGAYLEEKAGLLLRKRREITGTPTIADHYWVRNQIIHGTGRKYDAEKTVEMLKADVRRVLLELIERPELIPLILGEGSHQV